MTDTTDPKPDGGNESVRDIRLGDLEGRATIEFEGDRYRVREFLTNSERQPDVAILVEVGERE